MIPPSILAALSASEADAKAVRSETDTHEREVMPVSVRFYSGELHGLVGTYPHQARADKAIANAEKHGSVGIVERTQ
jgi:hypothetical protein